MEGVFGANELAPAEENNFTLVVHHAAQVALLEDYAAANPFCVWLKIDTGMHRLGFHPDEVEKIHARLMDCRAVKKTIGLMTHFAEADTLDSPHTRAQIELFNTTTKNISGPKSLANSAGIIAWPEAHGDWCVRYALWRIAVVGKRGVEHQPARDGYIRRYHDSSN